MSNQLIMQWVEMGNASLNALKQMSAASFTAAESNSAQSAQSAPSANSIGAADYARIIKATLDAAKQLNELSNDISTQLFLSQIKRLNTGLASNASQSLAELSENFSGQMAQQQAKMKAGMSHAINGCLANLQQAQTSDDISMVLAGFIGELNEKMKEGGGAMFGLLNSASAASTVWTGQALDEVIASDGKTADQGTQA